MKIVLDTNIIFSAVLNSSGKIGDLLLTSDDVFQFYTWLVGIAADFASFVKQVGWQLMRPPSVKITQKATKKGWLRFQQPPFYKYIHFYSSQIWLLVIGYWLLVKGYE